MYEQSSVSNEQLTYTCTCIVCAVQEREIDEMCSVHDVLLAQAQALAIDNKVYDYQELYTISKFILRHSQHIY
jgi:hypothetical protein